MRRIILVPYLRFELRHKRILSPPPLPIGIVGHKFWSSRTDSNRLKLLYKSRLHQQSFESVLLVDRVGVEPTDNCLQNSQEPRLNHGPLLLNRSSSQLGQLLRFLRLCSAQFFGYDEKLFHQLSSVHARTWNACP